MNPNISLPQLPANLDPALRDYLFAWQKLITSKQLDDYSANKSVDKKAEALEARLAQIESSYKNYSNIRVKPNASNPNYKIDIEWGSLYIEGILSTSGNFTLDITASGLLGLDTGSEAVSTWYYLWAIAKADGTVSVILSASSISPTMPAGYTLKRLVSIVRNNSSGNFTNFLQQNEHWFYKSKITYRSHTSATSEVFDVSGFIPRNSYESYQTIYLGGSDNSTNTVMHAVVTGYVNLDSTAAHLEAEVRSATGHLNVIYTSGTVISYSRYLALISTRTTGGTSAFGVDFMISGFKIPL